MPIVHTLSLGQLQTNCYIVHSETSKTCCIIDPADSPETVLGFVRRLGLQVDGVLLTHGHFDHVGAVESIVKATGCALWMHEGDYSMRSTPMNNYLYPLHDTTFTNVNFCELDEKIHAGGLVFTAIPTPGHTWGSICYQCGDALFTGDTLFAGGCGRTDLPGGDYRTILESLSYLAQLEGDFAVYPGHGESTTLAREKQYNPYLR